MRINTHKIGFVAAIALAGILGFGTVTALAGGDIGELLKNKDYREEFEAEKKAALEEWNEQVGDKVKDKDALWDATEVGPDATAVVKTELVPVTEEDFAGLDEASAKELKQLSKGLFNLKVYLDNGEVHQVGPLSKEPKRIELVDTMVDGVASKALVIEH